MAIKTDIVAEYTAAAGVTVDGVLLKDGQIQGTAPILADTISEKTSAAGVTVDSVLLKDGGATLIEPLIAQEETAASANPAAGYRKLYPYSAGGWMDRDDAGQIKAREFQLAMGANGAITIPAYSQTILCTKAGVLALTLANPTATTHDGVRLTIIATTAQANTVDNSAGAGFNGGGAGSDVATFGGAIGDNLVIEAYQGAWYVVSSVGVTLG